MKTTFEVTLNTSKMNKCYDSDDPSEFTKEHEITKEVEREIHNEFSRVLTSSDLLESLNARLAEGDITSVEGWEVLEDYGNIRVKVRRT